MKYKITIEGKDYSVQVKSIVGDNAQVEVNGKPYSVSLEHDGKAAPVRQAVNAAPVAADAPAQRAQAPMGAGKAVTAPLPGVIIQVLATPGQNVQRGQKIAVLEAMKMENDILAPADGQLQTIAVHQGDSVLEGALIATIA